jgi:hypothetical protein
LLKVVVGTVPFFSPIDRVRKVVSKKKIKRINSIRFTGLIRSSLAGWYKVSGRAILLIGSAKYRI